MIKPIPGLTDEEMVALIRRMCGVDEVDARFYLALAKGETKGDVHLEEE